jgi:hypothetical protein
MPRLVARPIQESPRDFSKETAAAELRPPADFLNSPRDVGILLRSRRGIAIGVCVAAAAGLAVPLWKSLHRPPVVRASAEPSAQATAATGTATFESNPNGLPVTIEGTVRGVTPLKLALAVGEHVVEIGSGPVKRHVTAAVVANSASSYYVELPAAPVAAAAVGVLEITSDPVGAQVSVDGYRHGVTPVALTALAAGDHRVTLTHEGTVINRTVRVTAGATASVVVSTRAPATAAGWVTISAPFEMKIFENGSLVGGTSSSRLMLPAGAHVFELVNDDLEFTTSVSLQVIANKTATAAVTVPKGLLSVNAVPWAEVQIDGEDAGVTPLGNLTVAIGTHEVVWRHPQLGERRRSVTVRAKAPARIGVDFNQ